MSQTKWLSRGLGNALLTLMLSLFFNFVAETIMKTINILPLACLLLLLVILVGALVDMVGFAAAAAELEPLNARAANKVWGAKQAVRLYKNADQVAIFCSDVLGDIAGTLAGALGALIVVRILVQRPHLESLALTIMTAVVAAALVGCKAVGKAVALSESTEIIFRLGQLVAWVEKFTGFEFFRPNRGDKVKRK